MARRTLRQVVGTRVDPTRPAIVVDRVTQTYRLYHERPSGLKERLYRWRRASYTDLDALHDVSLSVAHGESVGIVGHNGSGKSTLLKLLARILPPDEGRVRTNGRVASLLELGAGFHGDLTGRENVYLNGAILGLSRAEIDERFDDIIDFAGVGRLLDTAVRTYSSGLYVRLGFAIAVAVDPDILLVDEVLAVGDAEFQERSLERMRAFRDAGRTFVLVSHDLEAIQGMCDRVVVLEHGHKVFDGAVSEGVETYRRRLAATAPAVPAEEATPSDGPVVVEDVRLLEVGSDRDVGELAPGSACTLRVRLAAHRAVGVLSVGFRFTTLDGAVLHETHTAWQGLGIGPLVAGEHATVELRFAAHLLAGTYAVGLVVTDATGRDVLVESASALRFAVSPAARGTGVVDLGSAAAVVEGPARRLDGGS